MTALLIDADVRAEFAKLRKEAVASPFDVRALAALRADPEAEAAHHAKMLDMTTVIPGQFPWLVSYWLEVGRPRGPCRHLVLSVLRKDRMPNEDAAWLVASELGFVGGLADCHCYLEDIGDGRRAVNVVQLVSMQQPANA